MQHHGCLSHLIDLPLTLVGGGLLQFLRIDGIVSFVKKMQMKTRHTMCWSVPFASSSKNRYVSHLKMWLGQTNPYNGSLEARVYASNKEWVYELVRPNPQNVVLSIVKSFFQSDHRVRSSYTKYDT